MELYQLRTFVAVAEEGHLTRAADKLFISQPAVSAHIKSLEEELNVTLFTRTSRGMEPTEAGRHLKATAEKALAAAQDMVLLAKSFQTELSGEAHLGVNTDPGFLRLNELLATMPKLHPNLQVHIHQSSSSEIQDEVKEGRMDAGFIFGSCRREGIESRLLCRVKLFAVAPKDWKDRIIQASWAELVKLPWVWTPDTCPFHPLIDEMFKEQGVIPNKTLVADNESIIRIMVAGGKGVCLMREDEAREAEAKGSVSVRWSESLGMDLRFVYRKERENDPLIRALLSGLSAAWPCEAGR